ncbi:hypothetical protein AA0X95_14485 [Bacillus sp. 1P10SD]|uniref:hypothetical protein n=1 Tax=Bacillus sp. 1P10SD TaxID=3132265 RepID=UPI0039A5A952
MSAIENAAFVIASTNVSPVSLTSLKQTSETPFVLYVNPHFSNLSTITIAGQGYVQVQNLKQE